MLGFIPLTKNYFITPISLFQEKNMNKASHIHQIYTGCLSQGSYFIHSDGEAIVIDPLRESEPYIEKAKSLGVKIKYVLETHFHADFVSGHVSLAEKTGATIIYGPGAKTEFKVHIAEDNEEIKFGNLRMRVLHTPGHTLESTCYLLISKEGKEEAIFSGDTLFLGDVGRPDLAQKSGTITQDELAGMLFDSLREKIMVLPSELIIYPGHGAGSACGKNLSKETVGTLKDQLENNYALRIDMSREEFISEVTDGLLPPPAYFPLNVAMNKKVIPQLEDIFKNADKSFEPIAFEAMANEMNALVLDTRKPQEYAAGHIPRSVNIGLDGQFAPWAGVLIPDIDQKILIVTEEGREEETIRRLSRVGYDNVLGFLEGGYNTWKQSKKETDTVESIDAEEFANRISKNPKAVILDVRKDGEYRSERMMSSNHIPLDDLNTRFNDLPKGDPVYIHCAGGYRSMIFSSILKKRGIHNIVDIQGGFGAIKKTEGLETTDYICPNTNVPKNPEDSSIKGQSTLRSFLKRLLGR
jgi:glyoxylase-like metal-dependent hydrolase (beta-lactamase superfamily II)/rhodanese-related sulfurtransferase